jgi:hypothetical protein
MNYLEKISQIVSILDANGYSQFAHDIKMLQIDAMTSTELLMSVTHRLIEILNEEQQLKGIIGLDIDDLKKYCVSIGLIIK